VDIPLNFCGSGCENVRNNQRDLDVKRKSRYLQQKQRDGVKIIFIPTPKDTFVKPELKIQS